MTKYDHIHKYFRVKFKKSGTVIYRCGLDGCPHFIYEPMIIGKISTCWRCKAEFTVTRKSLRAKKLHCEDCTRPDPKEGKKSISEEIGKEVDQLFLGIEESGDKQDGI